MFRQVEANITIQADPKDVLKAFTDAQELQHWWGVERCFIELKQKGNYTLTWDISERGFRYVFTGIIKNHIPNEFLHLQQILYLNPERPILGPFELKVSVVSQENGSRLNVKQGPYPKNKGEHMEWYYESVTKAWPEVLKTIKAHIEKHDPNSTSKS
jgi:uncharacterized protein YndB with AHSA1/START domain